MRCCPQREQHLRAGSGAFFMAATRKTDITTERSKARVLPDHRLALKRSPFADVEFDLPE